jgi:tetraacyldisaccharide 4'-kinase
MAGVSQKEKIKYFLHQIIERKDKNFLERILSFCFKAIARIYEILLNIRLYIYDHNFIRKYKPKVKVISVGNITVGGTGKTPLVALLAGIFIKANKKTAIISRGYKAMHTVHGVIADEPMMLKKQFPQAEVIISSDRLAALKNIENNMNFDVVILDDAFQNLKIKKTLDIVCIDSRDPFGNYCVLPGGIMRLSFNYLKNADVFILTHYNKIKSELDDLINKIKKYNNRAEILKACHKADDLDDFSSGKKLDLSYLKNKSVALVCAIANPQSFYDMIDKLGAKTDLKFGFSDHYVFSTEEIMEIFGKAKNNNTNIIVITSKDEPRLRYMLNDERLRAISKNFEILVFNIKLDLGDDEKRFDNILSSVYTA